MQFSCVGTSFLGGRVGVKTSSSKQIHGYKQTNEINVSEVKMLNLFGDERVNALELLNITSLKCRKHLHIVNYCIRQM